MITINGNEFPYPSPLPLDRLLLEQGYPPERIAVELNGRIVPRAEYISCIVPDNSTMEIVSFVGGG